LKTITEEKGVNMKITREDSNVFEAKEKPFFRIAIGLILLIVGVTTALNLFPSFNIPIAISIFLILAGGVIFLLSEFVTLTAEKQSQKITISRRAVLKNSRKEFDFTQVKRLLVQQSMKSSSKGGSKIVHTLYLDLKEGPSEILGSHSSSSSFLSFFSSPPMRDIGKRLAAFIGVPFEEAGLPTFGQITDMMSTAMAQQTVKK
jgi:hypothetical protein